MQKNTRHGYRTMFMMSVNGVSMIFGFLSKLFGNQFARSYA
jgi:hypothetical protein